MGSIAKNAFFRTLTLSFMVYNGSCSLPVHCPSWSNVLVTQRANFLVTNTCCICKFITMQTLSDSINKLANFWVGEPDLYSIRQESSQDRNEYRRKFLGRV
ncbi:hypothetical protein CDAR_53631 [Caerostris darwini]|uniref:Secreted protein n=1 Tax=Caerostris darwini TaxID=1538125 RepID=A0AAV4VR41_9ARAC|nr:hypothetical protein CDAR_53631 [Caerostris darwini]